MYATRDVSGAHLNPAITMHLVVNDGLDLMNVAVPYIASQIAGATIAGGINYAMYRSGIQALHVAENKIKRGTAASNALFNGAFHMIPNKKLVTTTPGALVVEACLTGCLVFMISALTDQEKTVPSIYAPTLVGTVVAALVIPGAPLTGCGMNPARE